MNASHFDAFVRILTSSAISRRVLARGLAGIAVAAGLIQADWEELDARKRQKQRRRKDKKRRRNQNPPVAEPQPGLPPLVFNEFGCVDVGQPCRGDGANCCSGICQGSAPVEGQPDSSLCVTHDDGGCTLQSDSCLFGAPVPCGSAECLCMRTTGQGGFCADLTQDPGGDGTFCRVCVRDTDCAAEFGPGAACVVLEGICTTSCPATGGTACIPRCA